MHPCTCGHAPEEHGGDPEYPGSTACTECDCIGYEADPGEDDTPPPGRGKPTRPPNIKERAALAMLRDKGPQPAWAVDGHLWPNAPGRRISTNGGGTYASQMLLGRMRRQGWCQVQHGEGSSIWEITPGGLAALAVPPPVRLRLSRVQVRVLVMLMLGVKEWDHLPGPDEIEGGCFVGALHGNRANAIAYRLNLHRATLADLRPAPYTDRVVLRALEKLTELAAAARVFPPDEPEGSEPLYVVTSTGAAETRRRHPETR